MRSKPWAKPELAACPYYIGSPAELKGKWRQRFAVQQPVHLELGCGKGGFISQITVKNPDINYIAVDIKREMLAYARRKTAAAHEQQGKEINNLLLAIQNIEQIDTVFEPADGIERIYINFCNPWPKPKHKKKRLTHTRQLAKYRSFLADGGEIHFKTDDDQLFEESVLYFKETGFNITYITRDLHQSGYIYNIRTEHEEMFSSEGIPIKFLIAKKGTLNEKNSIL